jgi:4-hydroxythreonine-4-phosphate dehydrogenase
MMTSSFRPSARPALRPRVALTLGDPGGIGPELVARMLERPDATERADLYVISDEQELADAMEVAGVTFDYATEPGQGKPILVDNSAHRPTAKFQRAKESREGGQWAMANLRRALELAKEGVIDSVIFAPLNKSSLHLAGMTENDEMSWFETVLDDGTQATELNILPELITGRVTSHVSLAEVADLITFDLVVERGELLNEVLKARGIERPRIAVCALNPHAGEGGKFGLHEIEIIEPAVKELANRDVDASGPYPSDTVFIHARNGDFDGVLTMYHDQGQTAVKLIGFDRGVTMAGGLSVPVCTPAHGTAFRLVGKREANLGAYEHAFGVAVDVATQARAARNA